MSTGEGSHVRHNLRHEVVLHGTWLYAGEILCDVQIIHTNFRPGSGDYEGPPTGACRLSGFPTAPTTAVIEATFNKPRRL
jgi:hypothetical protein